MQTLFNYLKQLSSKDKRQNTLCHRQMPDIATLKKEYSDYDVYVVFDGKIYYIIDADGNCIEMCCSLREVQTELGKKKTIIMKRI